jgi:hypothetical protein
MRKKLVSFCTTVLMSLSFCVMPMRLSSAEQPTEQIKGAIERISQVLQEVTAARGANKEKRSRKSATSGSALRFQ